MAWERQWEHADALRAQIAEVRVTLASLAENLREVADVSDLINLPTPRSPGSAAPVGRVSPEGAQS